MMEYFLGRSSVLELVHAGVAPAVTPHGTKRVTVRPLSIDCLITYLVSVLLDAGPAPSISTQICVTGDESLFVYDKCKWTDLRLSLIKQLLGYNVYCTAYLTCSLNAMIRWCSVFQRNVSLLCICLWVTGKVLIQSCLGFHYYSLTIIIFGDTHEIAPRLSSSGCDAL